jgi:iron complex outermembrane receptor protein
VTEGAISAAIATAGARKEKVSYKFKPQTGSKLNETNHLTAWDLGANYKFTSALSMFANYNQAFQSPDVDRFFNTNFMTGETTFNGFIEPAEVRTVNVGFYYTSQNNRLKISVFNANLDNEIYLFQIPETFFFKNTNFDQSYKYGLEVQDFYGFNDTTTASVIYNFTRAKIDREDDAAGAYNGKDLPGVPNHTIVANLNIKFLDHAMFNLNQTWRAKTYAYNDFENNFSQKQDSYQTTNLALSYQYKNMQFYTAINNLFAHENSIQVLDDAIYPVDFVRTWRVGMKADF